MDYREYRKKYGSAQSGQASDNGEKLTQPTENYKNGGGASTNTGSVTRNYRTLRSKKKKYGTRSKKSAAAKGVIAAIIGVTVLLILTVCLALVTSKSLNMPEFVARKLIVEAGRSSIRPTDFLKDKTHTAEFMDGTDYSLNKVGDYSIPLLLDGTESVRVTLSVVDTVAPTALPKSFAVRRGHSPNPANCVSNIQDATEVRVTFDKTYAFTELGPAEVGVLLTDEGGNVTKIQTTVNVVTEDADILVYTVDLEVGNPFPGIVEFVGDSGHGAFVGDISSINTSELGKIEMGINVDGKVYTVYVNVVDTVAPEGVVSPIKFYNNVYPTADKFFTSIKDKTAVTASYVVQPNWNAGEKVPVRLLLTDTSGNKKEYNSYAVHATDTVAPVLTMSQNIIRYSVGDGALLWRSFASATDDSGEEVALSLDYKAEYLERAGLYTIFVVAKDAAGNESRQSVTLEVTDKAITREMLYEYIKPIVDSLNLQRLNQKQQAEALFQYLQSNQATRLHYKNDSPHDDWIKQAYLALSGDRHGDCFVFASVAQGVFQYLGYETVMVRKADAAVAASGGSHFWVMVNFNKDDPLHDHWYHFDGTPQTGAVRDPAFYMMTTEQVKSFTKWRDAKLNNGERYYEYDESAYPTSDTKVAVPFTNKELTKYIKDHGLKE